MLKVGKKFSISQKYTTFAPINYFYLYIHIPKCLACESRAFFLLCCNLFPNLIYFPTHSKNALIGL